MEEEAERARILQRIAVLQEAVKSRGKQNSSEHGGIGGRRGDASNFHALMSNCVANYTLDRSGSPDNISQQIYCFRYSSSILVSTPFHCD